jgi:hypothetical protein
MKKSQNVHRQKAILGLIRRHPIASVFALWVALLLLAGLSTVALVNVNTSTEAKATKVLSVEPSEPEPSEPATSELVPTQQPIAEHREQEQTLPLLSFGAIALSCTLGCLILSQTLRSTGYQSVQQKNSQVRSASLPQSAEPHTQESVSVTVVPKQQNHPLDWDEPSLADSLDLRQRRPLSHWL